MFYAVRCCCRDTDDEGKKIEIRQKLFAQKEQGWRSVFLKWANG